VARSVSNAMRHAVWGEGDDAALFQTHGTLSKLLCARKTSDIKPVPRTFVVSSKWSSLGHDQVASLSAETEAAALCHIYWASNHKYIREHGIVQTIPN